MVVIECLVTDSHLGSYLMLAKSLGSVGRITVALQQLRITAVCYVNAGDVW